jgi:hypothetical protein
MIVKNKEIKPLTNKPMAILCTNITIVLRTMAYQRVASKSTEV